jgi:glyoxalase family protein
MSPTVSGLHHVTAIATDPQRNLDFYAGTLGLRLVKRTVNFDDPGTYHLYYGDRIGRPGTLLTFFPWPGVRPGRVGVGQAIVTAFRVPAGAIEFWEDRLGRAAVGGVTRRERFGEISLRFSDPDGMGLELIASGPAGESVWDGPVPTAMQIQSLHGSILHLQSTEDTIAVLTEALGMVPDGVDGVMSRFRPADPAGGGVLGLIRDLSGTNGASHRLAGAGREAPAGAARCPGGIRSGRHSGDRPPVFPVHLFPRAGRRALRDRDRWPGVSHRRGGAGAGTDPAATASVRGQPAGD